MAFDIFPHFQLAHPWEWKCPLKKLFIVFSFIVLEKTDKGNHQLNDYSFYLLFSDCYKTLGMATREQIEPVLFANCCTIRVNEMLLLLIDFCVFLLKLFYLNSSEVPLLASCNPFFPRGVDSIACVSAVLFRAQGCVSFILGDPGADSRGEGKPFRSICSRPDNVLGFNSGKFEWRTSKSQIFRLVINIGKCLQLISACKYFAQDSGILRNRRNCLLGSLKFKIINVQVNAD